MESFEGKFKSKTEQCGHAESVLSIWEQQVKTFWFLLFP
jgi:hypothetical protein